MSDGRRRCDAICHRAKHGKCGCICGGKFHGAQVNVAKSAEKQELNDLITEKTLRKMIVTGYEPSPNQPRLVFEDTAAYGKHDQFPDEIKGV